MTKHKIVEQISKDKEYYQLCRSLSPEYYKDLYQDLMLILLNYDEVTLVDIYNRGKLKFFIIKILMNQTKSSTSPFHKTYRKYLHVQFESVFNYIDEEYTQDPTEIKIDEPDLFDSIMSYIELYSAKDDNNWFRAELFKEYLKAGSIRELSKRTTIPVMSIHRSLNEFKVDIKKIHHEHSTSTTK